MNCPKCFPKTVMLIKEHWYGQDWYEHYSDEPYLDSYKTLFECQRCGTEVETVPTPVTVTIRRNDE